MSFMRRSFCFSATHIFQLHSNHKFRIVIQTRKYFKSQSSQREHRTLTKHKQSVDEISKKTFEQRSRTNHQQNYANKKSRNSGIHFKQFAGLKIPASNKNNNYQSTKYISKQRHSSWSCQQRIGKQEKYHSRSINTKSEN